jgi:cyclophilin family peptidyl-prolyl cis-trans isomerase/HEAT repeat protein
MRYIQLLSLGAMAALCTACASAPSAPPATRAQAPAMSANQKMAWILRLEDQRILRAPEPPPPVVTTPAPPAKGARKPVEPPPAVVPPDLAKLAGDADPRVRRRAVLAIGRVGLPEGAAVAQPLLTDTDPDVRQMAAFALGLLADKSSVPPLLTALQQDTDARVRGRAAEALGLIGDASSAGAVSQMVSAYVKAGAIASIAPDEEQWPNTPESDAVRLGLFALVRLKAFDPLRAAVQDASGRVSGWWPVAYALQRINDPRAVPMLQELAKTPGRYTRAFAVRGLGAAKDASSLPLLQSILDQAKGETGLTVVVVRALGQIGAPQGAAPLLALLNAERIDPNVRLEALNALVALRSQAALPAIQDYIVDEWPPMRAAAVRGAATLDPQGFVTMLSGMEPDQHWTVRAAVAEALGSLPPDVAIDRLRPMLQDQDKRVIPAVIQSLAKLKAPGLDEMLLTEIKNADVGVRAGAATAIGQAKPAGGPAALRDAFRVAQADAITDAREAALTALAEYGAAEAGETVKAALADKDWALRLKAAALARKFDPSSDAMHAIRPVPGQPIAPYESPDLINPQVSPHAFIETAKGTIEIELSVLDAPQTVQNFITLARKGYFNGLQIHRVVPNFVIQDGDPRGDGSGGPGYTIRDELNDRPFLRGTVGMALSGPDTGGSQFFITHSPQPHLDAKYTVFGRVVQGMEFVDRIQQLDVIQSIKIWDGKELK